MRIKKSLIALASALSLVVGLAVLPNANAATTVKMVLWPGPEGDAMQKVVDAYNSSQGKKDGVTVKMILLSRDNTFAKEAALMKAKSSEYDIYFTASYLVGQHAPYLSDLKGVKDSLYLKASVNSLKVAGKQKALPLDTSLHFMYYRKDLVSTLSANAAKYSSIAKTVLGKDLKPNTNPATWNWDDALATAAFFTQKYNPESPTKYGYALPAKNLLYNTMIWNDVLWGLGGNWLKNGKPNLNTPTGKAAIDVYNTIYTKGLTSPESSQWEYAETNAALTSGNAAMGLNKFSKNQAAAAKWMAHLATVPAMKTYAAAGGVPSMPTILQGMVSTNASFANVIEYAGKFGYSASAGPREFDIYAALAEVLSPAWSGQKTSADVAADADAAIQRLRK
jgi:multiple sugar transport system substrate-binding protein